MTLNSLSRRLKSLSEWTGNLIAWLTIPMVLVTFVIVILRYVFDSGWIWMQESVLWMHALLFMLAGAYTLNRNEHVRVDIFYRELSAARKAWVDLVGTVVFLLPVSVFLIVISWDYVTVSWAIREGSREAGGLPYPFVPVLKTCIPLSFGLVVLQGAVIVIDSIATLLISTRSKDATGA